MATHSSVLAWRIPGMGKPGGLPSMGSHKVGHDWSNLAAAAAASLQLASFFFSLKYGKSLQKQNHNPIMVASYFYCEFTFLLLSICLYTWQIELTCLHREEARVRAGGCLNDGLSQRYSYQPDLFRNALETGFQNTIKLSKGDQAFLFPKDKVPISVITVVSTQVI